MTEAFAILLLVSLAWLIYTYFGYPLLLWVLARMRRRPAPAPDTTLPLVTVLTAAYDEADAIRETVLNKLALDYPADRLEVLVVSDGSTDGTDDIVNEIAAAHPDRVRLLRQEPRQGKTAALNRAVPEARGEILVFSDANSIYEKQALRELVGVFADPEVGYATGKMIYTNPDGSVTGDGCTAYMKYENRLRAWETEIGSVVGVDGGIDATRRELYQPMRADQLPDFVLPLRVVEQGYRVVYAPGAVLREPALSDAGREYRMRVRVTLRALWALWDLRSLLNPFRDPLFAWQLASHKVLRYLAFIPQITALVANLVLFDGHPAWRALMFGQVLFYGLAVMGRRLERQGGSFAPATAAWYFTLLNLACLHAFSRFVRGEKQVLWQPRTG